jgi:hypothetical protein
MVSFMKSIALIASITSLAALFAGGARAEEECTISAAEVAKFLPKNGQTAPPSNGLPIPPVGNDCGFYKWAWQSFLYVTEQKSDRRPAFLSYPTIERAFPRVFSRPTASPVVAKETSQMLTLSVRNIEPVLNSRTKWSQALAPEQLGDAAPVLNDGVMQAGLGGAGAVLVDRNRNPIFYTIHVNSVFADFVQANQLDDMERMLADPSATAKKPVPADLEFRPGAMEFKSSWMILDGPISEHPNYITTRARIPVLKNEPNKNAPGTHLVVDTAKRLREVNVALLGLHVVGVIDGHPEFIWATFEHADDKTGARDVAPAAHDNPAPSNTPPQTIDGSNKDYPLFKANTAVDKADTPINQPVGTDQKFANGTPVFRVFPGSASKKPDDTPPGQMEDPAITALNQQMTRLFSTNDPRGKDWRRHYRLVGAIWLDQPRKDDAFKEGAIFGADDVKLAGDNRLSNVSIESFTQIGAPHCFSCHNTDAQDQDLDGKVLPARLINISHIFTIVAKKYLSSLKQ